MSVMDHKPDEVGDGCIYCLEEWPCKVAKIRKELAEVIRAFPDCLVGSCEYSGGKDDGRESAADLIDIDS